MFSNLFTVPKFKGKIVYHLSTNIVLHYCGVLLQDQIQTDSIFIYFDNILSSARVNKIDRQSTIKILHRQNTFI